MLALTRKRRQSIMIGDDVEVTILSSDGAKVRRFFPPFHKQITASRSMSHARAHSR
jgi:hypothetical protein